MELGRLELNLLKMPLYAYQTSGAWLLGYRGRSILGVDIGPSNIDRNLSAV